MNNENLDTALQYANDYYIHLNKMNIGNRANNAIINFKDQKQQVQIETLKQYKDFFNTSLNGQSLEVLAAACDLNEEDFLNVLNTELQQKLQKDININALGSLYQIVNSGDISKYLQEAVDKNDVEQLSKALQIIAEALNLLEKGDKSLGAILNKSLKDANSFADIGGKLSQLLAEYQINNNYRLIKRQSLESAKKQLDNLAKALISGKFVSSKKDLTAKGLSTLLLNGIISTSIAQGLGFSIAGKSGSILYKSILEAVGTKNVTVTSNSDKNIKITGKTDVKAKGVSLTLEGIDGGENAGRINLNLGISSKFYTGQGFKDLDNKNISIGSGSGGTLKQALDSIFSDDVSRYLSYNYITHNQYVIQLNDLITKRQILRLFATAGSEEDFAQFMLINGNVISIWEILQYVLNNDVGLSSTMKGSSSQGIVIDIPNRPVIYASNVYDPLEGKGDNPSVSAWQRSHKVNTAIGSARIYAELHLTNLARSYIG